MNVSFYNAFTSMISQQEGLNIYSNNIANVNTVGFKPERPSFADCLYTIQQATNSDWETGHGQYLTKTDLMWTEGNFTATDQPLDFALPNSDFFMVSDKNGNSFLTRDGAFTMTLNADTGNWELVNGMGEYVLDYDGNHILIPGRDLNNINNIDYDALRDNIGVYSVKNNWGLEQADNNHFKITPRSSDAAANRDSDKVRGALEMSSVDIAGDMVRIITTQRSYQLSAKLLQTSDEFINIANHLRG